MRTLMHASAHHDTYYIKHTTANTGSLCARLCWLLQHTPYVWYHTHHHMLVTFYPATLRVPYNILYGHCLSHFINWLPQYGKFQRHVRSPRRLGAIPRFKQALKCLIAQPPPHQHEGMCARIADFAHDLTSQLFFLRCIYTEKV